MTNETKASNLDINTAVTVSWLSDEQRYPKSFIITRYFPHTTMFCCYRISGVPTSSREGRQAFKRMSRKGSFPIDLVAHLSVEISHKRYGSLMSSKGCWRDDVCSSPRMTVDSRGSRPSLLPVDHNVRRKVVFGDYLDTWIVCVVSFNLLLCKKCFLSFLPGVVCAQSDKVPFTPIRLGSRNWKFIPVLIVVREESIVITNWIQTS